MSLALYGFVEAESGKGGRLGRAIGDRLAANPVLRKKFEILGRLPAASDPLPETKRLAEIGKEAGASLLLVGTLAARREGVEVTTHLVHTGTARTWAAASLLLPYDDLPEAAFSEELRFQKKTFFKDFVEPMWLPNLLVPSKAARRPPRVGFKYAADYKRIFAETFEGPGDALPLLWSVNRTVATNGKWWIDPAKATGHSRALRLSINENRENIGSRATFFQVYRPLDVRELRGKRIDFMGWIVTKDLKGAASMGIYFSRQDAVVMVNDRSTSYQSQIRTTEIVVPEDASRALLFCQIMGNGGRAWFDDILIREVRLVPAEEAEKDPAPSSEGSRIKVGRDNEKNSP